MVRELTGSFVTDKILVLPPYEDCYIYKRPKTKFYQYFLSIEGEGSERKSCKTENIESVSYTHLTLPTILLV